MCVCVYLLVFIFIKSPVKIWCLVFFFFTFCFSICLFILLSTSVSNIYSIHTQININLRCAYKFELKYISGHTQDIALQILICTTTKISNVTVIELWYSDAYIVWWHCLNLHCTQFSWTFWMCAMQRFLVILRYDVSCIMMHIFAFCNWLELSYVVHILLIDGTCI